MEMESSTLADHLSTELPQTRDQQPVKDDNSKAVDATAEADLHVEVDTAEAVQTAAPDTPGPNEESELMEGEESVPTPRVRESAPSPSGHISPAPPPSHEPDPYRAPRW